MKKRKLIRVTSLLLCGAIGAACIPALAGCGKKDSIVLMTEELSGLFNPFYATSATDQDVIGMTQIGMLTYDVDDDGNVEVVAGSDRATVCEAFNIDDSSSTETVYTFVIKNGLKFSDGKPLTINDVFFNLYEYLDPVYTGSSTLYSVKIKGLSKYRTQKYSSEGGQEDEDNISKAALTSAVLRRQELVDIYCEYARIGASTSNSFSLDEEGMKNAILYGEYTTAANKADRMWEVTSGYKDAIATTTQQTTMTDAQYRDQLVQDYEFACKTHKEELEADFKAAKESFDTNSAPYDEWANELSNDIFKFFLYEGYITPVYKKVLGKEDKSKIEKFDGAEIVNTYTDEASAIEKVYGDNIKSKFNTVLTYMGAAGTVLTEFTATATEIVIKNNIGSSSTLQFPNVEGIVSLGHTTSENSVTINNVTYNVAHEHNEDGSPANANEYDVLQITVEGRDPKAIYNFGFSVTPAHYYTADSEHPNGREIDIAQNKFGVEYANSDFQSNTIKSLPHVEVPVGAGPYMATNRNNDNNPSGNDFVSGNIVYYKANPNFMFDVKTEKLRMQVVSPSDALDVLQSGAVDFVTPQFTQANSTRLYQMESSGYSRLSSWQLGYGYIGINAGKVPDVNIRRAIMSAMDISLSLEYYDSGTCKNIDWPMSMMNWAYPYEAGTHTAPGEGTSKQNGHSYTMWTGKEDAEDKIRSYMDLAGASKGDDRLKITFTIAGASITEHPTYEVFKYASELLNDLGWQVTVRADSQALTKLSTGSLEVWAAAWGSTIDPDMYQVYHKNSTATSVYAWGYREIKANPSTYTYETERINTLSDLIDDAREIMDQNRRAELYEQAMGIVLDLAVELPVYQRQNLYAFNSKKVKGFPSEVNAYTSPLEKVWELELI